VIQSGRSMRSTKMKEEFMKRKVTEKRLRSLRKELKPVSAIARRIGYTPTGTKRALIRFGIVRG
jgi:hypothetical protein